MTTKLAGNPRNLMVEFIRRPLAAWTKTHMKSMFPDAAASEAKDVVAEAMMAVLIETCGTQAARHVALDIIERTKS